MKTMTDAAAGDPADPGGAGRGRTAAMLGGVAGVAALTTAGYVLSDTSDTSDTAVPDVADPRPPSGGALLDPALSLHLARRATFGLTPTLPTEIDAAGASAWLEQQLDPASIEDDEVDALLLAGYPLLGRTAAQLQTQIGGGEGTLRLAAGNQLVEATLIRQIWSRRQLFEVMVDFWSNHLNVTTPLGPTYATKPVEDATVIRRHALGTFTDLLLADGQSPAMLIHLGNTLSRNGEPNENYGRELLELHTVGVDGGYTEDDVIDSAYALTGFGVGEDGTFAYTAGHHYLGPLQVLDWSADNATASGGLAVGRDYLRHLAGHEQTARHLSQKLVRRFVSDDPAESLVERLAQSYLEAGTAIEPWLRTLFSSPEFAASSAAKVRRPLEDIVASVRALGVPAPTPEDTAGVAALVLRARQLGQAPLGADPPTGYADVSESWRSTSAVLGRWNVHRLLTGGTLSGLTLPTQVPDVTTMGELVDALCRRLTGQPFRDDHRAALLRWLDADPEDAYDAPRRAGQIPDLVALVLDSPYHLLR